MDQLCGFFRFLPWGEAVSGGTGDDVVMAGGGGFPPIDFCDKEPLVLGVEVTDDAEG